MTDKVLCFDMDGTIADLYGVDGWLEMLRAENPAPYAIAKPLYDMLELALILNILQMDGWKIGVITWGAKNASAEYNKAVAQTKKEWLIKNNFPIDFFNFQAYGTPKREAIKNRVGRTILIDDNKEVRNEWNGETIDATQNILEELKKLIGN